MRRLLLAVEETFGVTRGGWRAGIGPLVLACLAVPTGATLLGAAWAVLQPVGLDYAEPVVYGQAMRIALGEALYRPIDMAPFTVAAYTPLYYWLAGALQLVAGAGFWPGRLLSLVAGVATAVMVGAIAGRQRSAWVGAGAALLFLAFGFPGPVPWLGLYRVDLLGVALSVGSVALLTQSTERRAVVLAGVLAGLAILCKQTFIAALLAGALWQWRDWPKAVAFGGAALLTFGIPCLVLEVTSKGAFLQNTVVANVNPFNPSIAAGLLPIYLATQWLPLLLAVVYLAVMRPWRQHGEKALVVLYWGLSSVPLLLGIAKIGANFNYWIEFAAATAILAARGADWVMSTSRRTVAVAGAFGLILALGIELRGPGGAGRSVLTVRSDVRAMLQPSRNVEFDALVERVRREPGGVLAEPMDVVVLAGRPVLLEPFIYNLLLDAGRWQPDALLARICNGEIGLVVLGYPLEVAASMTDGLYALWPAPVMTALQQTMTLDSTEATRYVYTPHPPPVQNCPSRT